MIAGVTTPQQLTGRTVHLLNGSKYAGEWTMTEVWDEQGEWFRIRDGRRQWSTRLADCFNTEQEARAEAKNRRQPRRARTPQPLYGDYATIAAINGISTDGTGRRVR